MCTLSQPATQTSEKLDNLKETIQSLLFGTVDEAHI